MVERGSKRVYVDSIEVFLEMAFWANMVESA